MTRIRLSSLRVGGFFLVGWLMLVAGVMAAVEPCVAAGVEPVRPVLEVLGDRASAMAERLPAAPTDLGQWQRRRREVRATLAAVLGLPVREPMRAAVTGTQQEGDVTIEDVQYLWAERAYATGNVVRLTEAKGPLPAIVSPPGWVGHLGEEYYRTWVFHMARKGYLVLFIDDPRVGKRKAEYAGFYGVASASGTQAMGVQVFDTLRGLDYLLTRADVDTGRIGISGLCQGSEQTWLAAALEDRFRVVSPVCGTTTYEWWSRMPAFLGVDLSDPSPYVEEVLNHTDWDEIDACIAPRPVLIASNSGDNWWPKPGFDAVVNRLRAVYGLYGVGEHFEVVFDLRSHSMTPYIKELEGWFERYLKPLPRGAAGQAWCGEPVEPDTNMVRYFQRRIARQSEVLPNQFGSQQAWQGYRQAIVGWLKGAAEVSARWASGGPAVVKRAQAEGGVEVVYLAQGDGLVCPARCYEAATNVAKGTVVLSHDSTACGADRAVVEVVEALRQAGWAVMTPEHVGANKASLRPANSISLYGVGDTVGRGPMVLRVWDDLACVDYVRSQAGGGGKLVLVGMGIGGVDAALAGALDERVDAVASVGVITMRDWADHVAPAAGSFDRVMPYVPGMLKQTDLQYYYASLAPRPLLLVDGTDRAHWPASGFARVRQTAGEVYELLEASKQLRAASAASSWGVQEVAAWLDSL